MSELTPQEIRESLLSCREIVLANTLMLGEIPAPTGQEDQRAQFLSDRFLQSELGDVSHDEVGNVQAIIPGKTGKRNILVAAHVDSALKISPDQRITINVGSKTMEGPGIGDNSLGLAAIASLPDILNHLGIELDANIVLLGHVKSLGKEDLGGMNFFLENSSMQFDAGLVVEGITLGRLNHTTLGMVQADIKCQIHHTPGSRWEASENAIVILHRIIKRILEIPVPQEPKTSIILGSIESGKTFNRPPELARLRLEVRSEMPGKAREIRHQITQIVEEISAQTASECTIEFPALRKPGGIPFNHPYVSAARDIQKELDITTVAGPSFSDISVLIEKEIPAMTVGLTNAHHLLENNEEVEINPIFTGLAQVVSILKELDKPILSETTNPEEETEL